jgi:hypothetical protein
MTLVAWLPLSGDGPSEANHGRYDDDGRVVGAVPNVTAPGSHGLTGRNFDGVDDVVKLDDQLYGTGAYTMAVWMRSTTTTNTNVMYIDFEGSLHRIQTPGGNVGFNAKGGSNKSFGTPICTGEWTHVALANDGSNAAIYVDGENVHNFSSGGYNAGVGSGAVGSITFPGDLFDGRIYDRRLSDAEVRAIYEWSTSYTPVAKPGATEGGISYWPFDSDATDQWGANDATVTGATLTSTAVDGSGYLFDGTDDYLGGIPAGTLDPNGDFTFMCWGRFDALSNANAIYGLESATSNDYWFIANKNNGGQGLTFQYDNGGGASYIGTNAGIGTGEWTHLAVSRNTDDWTFYIDGEVVERPAGALSGLNVSSAQTFGYLNVGSNYLTGALDEARLFSRALSDDEVASFARGTEIARDLRADMVTAR